MTQYGLVWVLLGSVAWGQTASSESARTSQTPAAVAAVAMAGENQASAAKVAADAPVVTISGMCDSPKSQKTTDSNCQTVITRAAFERLVELIDPAMPVSARRQFASAYAQALVMAHQASVMGLDRGQGFDEKIRLGRIRILAQELGEALQEKVSPVSDKDIADYYQQNLAAYEEADLKRIFIPRVQQLASPAGTQSKTDEQNRVQQSENIMKAEAEKVHSAAVAGADFDQLQNEAFQLAGIMSGSSDTGLGMLRRDSLPTNQVFVMDLKANEVSPIIVDKGGYVIYKVVEKRTVGLDEAREEIRGRLRAQRLRDEMKAIEASATASFEDRYFQSGSVR